MLSDDEAKLALSEVSTNLTRALQSLEEVPREAAATEEEEDLSSLQELITQAGQIVESALARRGDYR